MYKATSVLFGLDGFRVLDVERVDDDRPTTDMAEGNRRLRKEVGELRRANELWEAASAHFVQELDPTRRRS